MPSARLNATAIVRNAPPTRISQPVRGSLRRSFVTASSAEAADDRHAEQPARLAAERLVEQPQQPGVAAEHAAATAGPPPPPPGPPSWPNRRPRPL